MNTYVILIRGINVGGKNKIRMAELKNCLEALGCSDVLTYIASGNIIVKSDKNAKVLKDQIEATLPKTFKLDSELIKVLVLTKKELRNIIENKPENFGDLPETYHSDVLFLMGIDSTHVMTLFVPREGVDKVWPGDGAIYFQRLSAQRTKSRLNRIVGTPAYKSMTIRSWRTAQRLFEILKEIESDER